MEDTQRIATTLFERWQECNDKVREAVLDDQMERATTYHVRRDEVILLSVRFGVSRELDRMIDVRSSGQVIATRALSY